jgi:hypothetical protein
MIVLERVTQHYFKSLWDVKGVWMISVGEMIPLILLFGWLRGEEFEKEPSVKA